MQLLTISLFLLSTGSSALAARNDLVSTGLRNLGNTCYMNAQLECAFHIPLVRDIVLSKTEDSSSMGLQALRLLFSDMEKALPHAAAPVALCRTLGIPPMEQQDSQEFWKLLLPALGNPHLTDLYQGAYEDYITAVDGSGRERRREEPFLDLSLQVATHRSVVDSLADMFGTPELLSESEGNGWRPEKGADKVDALKGSLLRAQGGGLPSLLQLHLKRFQYNWQFETMNKLNSRFSFPAELDLTEVCSDATTKKIGEGDDNDAMYDLQSIVVHVGEYGSGHYYAYVRPDVTTKDWYRFDDDRVSQVTFRDVVRDAYGGKSAREERRQKAKRRQRGLLSRLLGVGGGSIAYGWGGPKSSAYMLQYVKRSDIEKLYNL